MSRGDFAVQIGKATKRSRFGESRQLEDSGTYEATKFSVHAGLDFHLIDSEWQQNYMSPSELGRNLSFLKEIESHLRLVVTVNARHLTAFDASMDYSEVIAQYDNGGFCFVAGNPTYLSEEERSLNSGGRIAELVATTRDRLPYAPIFVGSEGLTTLTSKLSQEFASIPFVLLDSSVRDKMAGICSGASETYGAVYCPCYLSADGDGKLVKAFGGYAMRRGWVRKALRAQGLRVADIKSQLSNGGLTDDSAVRVLEEAIRELALCEPDAAEQRLRAFSGFGIRYAALLLADESVQEGRHLESLVSQFN